MYISVKTVSRLKKSDSTSLEVTNSFLKDWMMLISCLKDKGAILIFYFTYPECLGSLVDFISFCNVNNRSCSVYFCHNKIYCKTKFMLFFFSPQISLFSFEHLFFENFFLREWWFCHNFLAYATELSVIIIRKQGVDFSLQPHIFLGIDAQRKLEWVTY